MSTGAYDLLFQPVKIGPVTAPNRFFAVPHATGHGWLQPHGSRALRAMKAEGGWGSVVSQMTEIAGNSDLANHPMDRLWDDSDIPNHAATARAIKAHGALAGIELAHGGMRARNFTTGEPVIGPSDLPILRPEVPLQARAMSLQDIATFRDSHRAAVKRAIKAGYDLIYVYAAHDLSILSHFLSLRTNQRSDDYGGSFDNRLRLLREVLEDTLELCSGIAGVALRFSVAEPDSANGLRHDGEGRDVVEALCDLPDLWDVNLGGWPADSQTARFSDEGYQLPFTDFVKSVTDTPVVGVGRFTSPDQMVSLIKAGRLDLIGAARPSIADPFLPHKIRDGRVEDIRECIGCNICVSMDAYGVPVRCTQNPTMSEEWRGWHPETPLVATGQERHLIVGAGPAGLEAARVLAATGAQVTVADRAPVAGGRLVGEAGLPGLSSWLRVRDYRLGQLLGRENVDLFLNSEMGADDIAGFESENVILATGAQWRADGVGATQFEGIDFGDRRVMSPDDVMAGRLDGQPREKIVIYDDDHFYMASVLAEKLAGEGHSVRLVTPLPMIAAWADYNLDQGRIMARMNALGVTMLANVKLRPDGSYFEALNGSSLVFDEKIVVHVGARLPVSGLYDALAGREGLHVAGDCEVPGLIQAAVYAGHRVARKVLGADDSDFSRPQVGG